MQPSCRRNSPNICLCAYGASYIFLRPLQNLRFCGKIYDFYLLQVYKFLLQDSTSYNPYERKHFLLLILLPRHENTYVLRSNQICTYISKIQVAAQGRKESSRVEALFVLVLFCVRAYYFIHDDC